MMRLARSVVPILAIGLITTVALFMLDYSGTARAAAHVGMMAATVPVPPADPGSLLGMLMTGHYLPAVGVLLCIAVAGLRAGATRLPKVGPWFGTRIGGYALAYITSYALYLGTAWQAGAPLTGKLFVAAFGAALTASGVLDHWRDLVDAITAVPKSTIAAAKTAIVLVVGCLALSCLSKSAVESAATAGGKVALNCLESEGRREAISVLTPLVTGFLTGATSADGKIIDTSGVKAAFSAANLKSEAGIVLGCTAAKVFADLQAALAPKPGAPASSALVIDPAALKSTWSALSRDQFGGATFVLDGKSM